MSEQSAHFPFNPGDRIVAVSHTDEDGYVYVFGPGLYQGEDIVGKEASGPSSALARFTGLKVPKYVLDDGSTIWGTECHVLRESELSEMLEAPGLKGMKNCSITEIRAMAPNHLVVKFFTPPDRQVHNLPVPASNETCQQMRDLEDLERGLHLEGEFLRIPNQFTITISNDEEDLDIEVVTSMDEVYQHALERLVQRVHKRLLTQVN